MVIRRDERLKSANRGITPARMYNIVCKWASKRFAPKPRRLLATLFPLNPTRLGQKRPAPNNRRIIINPSTFANHPACRVAVRRFFAQQKTADPTGSSCALGYLSLIVSRSQNQGFLCHSPVCQPFEVSVIVKIDASTIGWAASSCARV